jgi:hypothetical protein
MTWVHSGVLARSEGVFFSLLRNKMSAWLHSDPFLPKIRFYRKLLQKEKVAHVTPQIITNLDHGCNAMMTL